MPSKNDRASRYKHKNRKEFRKQQRKLKKKSKKLAKQFGKLQRENKFKYNIKSKLKFFIKTNVNHNTNNNTMKPKSILKHTFKTKSKQNKNKMNQKHSKSVRFADYEQIKIIAPRNNQKQQYLSTNNNNNNNSNSNNYKIKEKEDIWIDERDEKWIKQLEKRMGLRRNSNDRNNKYWKKQEFTQDGLDCFFDLEYLSDESDIDQQQQNNYKQYIQFKDFLTTQKTDNNKPKSQLNAFKQFKISNEEKIAKRRKKEHIYGEGVYHSDDSDENDNENDVLMKQFLEESDSNSDSDIQNENENENKKVVKRKYIPPQLRKLNIGLNGKNAQLKRCISGYLNRLLSHNLKSISDLINNFYSGNDSNYSRSEVTESFCECIYNMIYDKESNNALNAIILCLSGLIVNISNVNGIVIGSNIIEIFTNHIELSIKNKNNNKFMNNLMRMISYLYLFGMLNAKYIIEILIQFIGRYDSECFKILYIVMDICGIDLRNNDPIKFKDLIILICNKSKELNNITTKYSIQIEDTMKLIFDIKDNKILKNMKNYIQNSRSFIQLKKTIGSVAKMSMSYKDFINISENGRWWLPGAPIKGDIILTKMNHKHNAVWKQKENAYSFSNKLLTIAKKFHMNTPIRRAIFCIVMDSDDYIDAFQKLMELNINNGQHTEIIRIIVLLCLRQRGYNKYYCLLLGKLIKHKKGWKFSLHCALWDKFNEIGEMCTNDILNMSKLLGDLINLHYLNLVVLKRIDIIVVEPKHMLFVNTLFKCLLIKNHVFGTLSRNKQLKELKQDIELYLSSLMVARTKNEIIKLKEKHKNGQLLFKKNKMNGDELINIGLELRENEDLLILMKNVLNSMEDHQVQQSSYNDLIMSY